MTTPYAINVAHRQIVQTAKVAVAMAVQNGDLRELTREGYEQEAMNTYEAIINALSGRLADHKRQVARQERINKRKASK